MHLAGVRETRQAIAQNEANSIPAFRFRVDVRVSVSTSTTLEGQRWRDKHDTIKRPKTSFLLATKKTSGKNKVVENNNIILHENKNAMKHEFDGDFITLIIIIIIIIGQDTKKSPGNQKKIKKKMRKKKQLYWHFKQLINNISQLIDYMYRKNLDVVKKKGNHKIETESFLTAAQNNSIRTNHIKARIHKTQQNSKCRLCGDRDETINHLRSEGCKIAQNENKTRHDLVGKVIHWELCKKFKFDYANQWYMHNPAFFPENDTHKLLWDVEIQTDHLILARRPDLKIIKKKKTCKFMDFFVPGDPRIKLKEGEKKDKYLDLARELKKNYGTWRWQ